MRLPYLFPLATALLLVAPTCARAIPIYNFVNFDALGSTSGTIPLGINNLGEVVGFVNTGGSQGISFIRNPDGSTVSFTGPALGAGANDSPFRHAINDAGQITGTEYLGTTTQNYVRNADGTFALIAGPANAYLPQITGINNAGQITFTDNQLDGFLRQPDGTFVQYNDPSQRGAFVPEGINNDGTITGFETDLSSPNQGFLRRADRTGAIFQGVNGRGTTPLGINDAETIVGFYYNYADLAYETFVRNSDGSSYHLIDPAATGETSLEGINDAGQIVGYYTDGSGTHGFIATPQGTATTPEPSSVLLLGTGLTGLGVVRRRYRKHEPGV